MIIDDFVGCNEHEENSLIFLFYIEKKVCIQAMGTSCDCECDGCEFDSYKENKIFYIFNPSFW